MRQIHKIKMQERRFKTEVDDKSPTIYTEAKRQEMRFDEEAILSKKRAAFIKKEQAKNVKKDEEKIERKWYSCC